MSLLQVPNGNAFCTGSLQVLWVKQYLLFLVTNQHNFQFFSLQHLQRNLKKLFSELCEKKSNHFNSLIIIEFEWKKIR